MTASITKTCPHCGKGHRLLGWDERVAACEDRALRRAEREQAQADDVARRLEHAKKEPLEAWLVGWIHDHTRIRFGRWETSAISNAVSHVKKNYPPPAEWPHRCRTESCLLCTPMMVAKLKKKSGAVIAVERIERPKEWNAALLLYVDSWRLNWGAV